MKQPESAYPKVTGIILAGGRSRRMGRDKATLEVGGTTLFDRASRMMQELFDEILIAGDRRDLSQSSGIPCYPDVFPGSALGGMYTGLFHAGNEMGFVCSCDMLSPNSDIARLVVSQDHAYDVVVPRTADGLEPLFARYHRRTLPAIKEMLEQKHFCVYNLYPRVRTLYVDIPESLGDCKKAFLNLNTPEEYRRVAGML